jgi:hypothetical protein
MKYEIYVFAAGTAGGGAAPKKVAKVALRFLKHHTPQ